jgi:hypothetical protein
MLATPRDAKYVDVIEKLTGKPLARRSMMDIEVREENRPHRGDRDRGGRGGRDRDRGRGRDGKHRDRRPPDGKYHEHVAAMEPTEAKPMAEQPAPEARSEKPRNEHRGEQKHEPRKEQRAEHRNEPRGEQRQEPKKEPRAENREKRDRHPRGAQPAKPEAVDKSELPAFLFRPVPVKKPVPQS